MTIPIVIDLTPAEEARLNTAAQQNGIAPTELAHKLVTEHLPSVEQESQDPTLALFAQWKQEDAHMTPEEIEAERLLWEQFETGINETRQASGMRTL